jgi:hypothetical protein
MPWLLPSTSFFVRYFATSSEDDYKEKSEKFWEELISYQSQDYFTTDGLLAISSSWRQAPCNRLLSLLIV